jgi:hypothetical protein
MTRDQLEGVLIKGAVYIAAIILLMLYTACSKSMPEGLMAEYGLEGDWSVTTVKQGQHKFSNRPVYNMSKHNRGLTYHVMFDSSCIYYHADPSYQDSWNKSMGLYAKDGFCGGKPQHSKSALVGWRWYDERMQVGWYIHPDCDSTYEAGHLTDVELMVPYMVQVFAMPKNVWYYRIMEFKDGQLLLHAEFEYEVDWDMTAYSYGWTFFWFGGIYSAMHDMTVFYSLIRPSAQPTSLW